MSYNNHLSLIKVTLPDTGFGLIPHVTLHRKLDIRSNEISFYKQIEFVGASPLEYIERWLLCNELFGDAVSIKRIIRWQNSSVSIMVSQPYYMGEVISRNEIHEAFKKNGWDAIYRDGRPVFYHFGYDAIALDLEPRNCYLCNGKLQPFDLIVSHPNEEMRDYLEI